jgi:hypothetical protein
MKKFLLLFVLVVFVPGLTRAATDHLVINQIQATGGSGHTTDDFIEIYNPTDHAIDLQGMRLVKRTQAGTTDTLIKSWTDSVQVPAKGYYLWANSNFSTISITPDITTSASIADDNGIALRSGPNDTGAIVDAVAWGSATNTFVETTAFATNPVAGQVLTRAGGADTDNNSTDFSLGSPSPHNLSMSPVPNPEPTPTPPQDQTPNPPDQNQNQDITPAQNSSGGGNVLNYSNAVVISEFLPNPDGPDDGEEWVELYNSSSSPVDLSGWKLDDESKDGSIGSTAYTIPAGTSLAGLSYLAIDLPNASFALNNTGGDSVRLISPDKTLVQTVSYTGNVKVDTTYARKTDGSYAWSSIPTKGTANQFENLQNSNLTANTQIAGTFADDKIRLNELFPNPVGPDSGQEWIEVINLGSNSVTLHGWIVDDGAKDDPIGSTAYHIESPTVIAGGVAVITIPSGKFAMNNSGTETVRLFTPDAQLVDFVTYTGAAEGSSYSRMSDNKWVWTIPTPGVANSENTASDSVVINEILPYPLKDQEEFIELKNISDKAVDLSGWKLKDKDDSFTLGAVSLDAGAVFVIKRSVSSIALANKAKEQLELVTSAGDVVSALEYEDAPRGEAFARNTDGDYVWTKTPTPGKENALKSSGKVAGATLVRTGAPDAKPDPTVFYFAVFAIIWYIVGRVVVNVNEEI